MNVPDFMRDKAALTIKTIDMHTAGEPTRIIYSGFPDLEGTLLEQRAAARSNHDHIRRAVILEPRGHRDMYGAVLRPRTEHVGSDSSGQAHMGVLFFTGEGYSTMCGHATLAVARMLVDYSGSGGEPLCPFPAWKFLAVDHSANTVQVCLHVPAGLVVVEVPITVTGQETFTSDPSRQITYLSVPSFATALDLELPIPTELRWPQLASKKDSITVNISYGGAFFLLAPVSELGFPAALEKPDLRALDVATKNIKQAFNASEEFRQLYLHHPDHDDLRFLYSVCVTDASASRPHRTEKGVLFFADQQIDRSPTGSGVQARVALACTRGERGIGQTWSYRSLLADEFGSEAAFDGTAVEEVGEVAGKRAWTVRVGGRARYTGVSSFAVEEGDAIGKGFSFEALGS